MTRFDINILGKKYIFLGINESIKNVIEAQANTKDFVKDFELWRKWMQSVTGDEAIVVYDPYGIAEISVDDISAASSSNDKAVIAQEAAKTANALTAYLGGNAKSHVESWRVIIGDMFLKYNRAKIYGIQYNYGKLKNTSVGSFESVLFIDFISLIEKKPGLLLPTIMHETTHFLEAKQIENGCFGERGILKERVHDDRLWGVESAGSLGKDPDWRGILGEMAAYQGDKDNEHERLTTLIEKMTVGSLYESVDRTWVEELKATFSVVLAERGIKL